MNILPWQASSGNLKENLPVLLHLLYMVLALPHLMKWQPSAGTKQRNLKSIRTWYRSEEEPTPHNKQETKYV